ncbi:DRTGG domain-containing protein [Prolixibacter sp. SD074]|uniref:DRTGG domain-containing protein n=1 Tax=Prolixibacter sp. SD074 TaxID=2652391 RepID=UPI0012992816|nr:DRTGG domain-containing protein [Prolixibacter sp. SD074]
MNVKDVQQALGLKIFGGEKGLSREVTDGYVSDLLSDAMGNATEGMAWMTLQTHLNVVAIASLKDLAAVILVNGNLPEKDTLAKANEENIPVLGTKLSTFEIAGKLFQLLNS